MKFRAAGLALVLFGCATAAPAPDRYERLSPASKALYDRYHQFMTEERADAFLEAPGDAERQQMVRDLHVEERVGRYPRYVQDAIWSRTAVVGMDRGALFLAMGQPDVVERENDDDDAPVNVRQLVHERWHYRRGPNVGQEYVITVVGDQVLDVVVPRDVQTRPSTPPPAATKAAPAAPAKK